MTDGVNTTLFYRKTEEDDWKPVITTNFKESFSLQFFHFRQQKSLRALKHRSRSPIANDLFESGRRTLQTLGTVSNPKNANGGAKNLVLLMHNVSICGSMGSHPEGPSRSVRLV